MQRFYWRKSNSQSKMMALRFLGGTFAVLVCLSSTHSVLGNVYKSERELRQDIFWGYDKLVRPVKKASTAVPVNVNMIPLALRSVNEKEQVITLDTWLVMQWTDEYLQWDPSEYDNITEFHVHSSEIWKPDLSLYTATPVTSLFPVVQTQALLLNDGRILWVPPFTITSRCPLSFRTYGAAGTFIDCNIRFGSWTYSGKLMDLQLFSETVDLEDFQDFNRDWKLVKIVSNRESRFYPCCTEDYPLVNFNITLKRRNYYIPGSEN